MLNQRVGILALILVVGVATGFPLCDSGIATDSATTPHTPSSNSRVDGVKAALLDPHPSVLVALMSSDVAVEALQQIGVLTPLIISRFVGMLNNSDPVIREAAIKVLGWTSGPQKLIAKHAAGLLHDSYPPVVIGALWTLGRMGEYAGPYGGEIFSLVEPPNELKIRLAALRAIGDLGQAPTPLWDRSTYEYNLSAQLQDPDLDLVWETATTLFRIGTFRPKEFKVDLDEASDSDWEFVKISTAALANMGEAAKPHVPKLAFWLNHSNPGARLATARTLGQLGPLAVEALPQLVAALQDSRASVRAAAAAAMGTQTEAIAPYLPKLIDALEDSDGRVRESAAWAFANLPAHTGKGALPRLVEKLKNSKPQTRSAAVLALGNLGLTAGEHTKAVADLGSDPTTEVREAVAFALSRMDASCETALSLLIYLLDSKDFSVHKAAAQGLTRCGTLTSAQRKSAALACVFLALADPNRLGNLRFLAHFVGAGIHEVEILLAWVGHPSVYPQNLSIAETINTLEILQSWWKPIEKVEKLGLVRDEISTQMANIIKRTQWKLADVPILKDLSASLRETPGGLASRRILERFDSIQKR